MKYENLTIPVSLLSCYLHYDDLSCLADKGEVEAPQKGKKSSPKGPTADTMGRQHRHFEGNSLSFKFEKNSYVKMIRMGGALDVHPQQIGLSFAPLEKSRSSELVGSFFWLALRFFKSNCCIGSNFCFAHV